MIKIAHVIYSFGIGGLEKGITTLINHGSDDIEHVIISLCGNKDSETLLRRAARIICLDKQGGNSLRFIRDLAKVIRAVGPDVVHTRNWSGMDGILAARLDAIKNHGALIDAVNRVAQFRPDVKLVVVGDGPEAAALKARAGDRVRFPGYRSDTVRLLQGFDLFVLPSFNEGISNTILEAMATGLPVIASNVGGNPELVADGKTGFLVDPHKPGDMADIITAYMDDPDMMARHGEQGRLLAVQKFSIQAMVDQYESVYRGL